MRHHRQHRAVRGAFAATATLALLALGACTGSDDEPGAETSADATSEEADPDDGGTASEQATASATPTVAPPPADAACYRVTFAETQEAQNDAAGVACGQRHNAQTFHVGRLSATAPPAAVVSEARDTCRRQLRRHVGATTERLALSRVESTFYVPSDEDLAAGARWLRCDVVVKRTADTLARLPRRSAGMLSDDEALDRWGACAKTGESGLNEGRGQRICDLDHTWRAIDAQRLGSGDDPYPGRSEVRGDVLERCEDPARAWTGNETGDIAVGWRPPTRAAWAAGERFGLCWTRTDQ
ncbi:putative regulator of septum formation [Mumia flava]|uniref:Putative regulator of septum formation n=1 Tax=Mumia flava TaxID=1348852 RepID=A0A0B2BAU9_9ACTN|nr:septum formation family protein [Mumia flava]PJJ53886.1 putative regulator of septum formation [Mumia flava]